MTPSRLLQPLCLGVLIVLLGGGTTSVQAAFIVPLDQTVDGTPLSSTAGPWVTVQFEDGLDDRALELEEVRLTIASQLGSSISITRLGFNLTVSPSLSLGSHSGASAALLTGYDGGAAGRFDFAIEFGSAVSPDPLQGSEIFRVLLLFDRPIPAFAFNRANGNGLTVFVELANSAGDTWRLTGVGRIADPEIGPSITPKPTAVPEPGSLTLLMLGSVTITGLLRSRWKATATARN